MEQLSDLIGLSLPSDLLHVQEFRNGRVNEDVVATAHAGESKSKRLRQGLNLGKPQIVRRRPFVGPLLGSFVAGELRRQSSWSEARPSWRRSPARPSSGGSCSTSGGRRSRSDRSSPPCPWTPSGDGADGGVGDRGRAVRLLSASAETERPDERLSLEFDGNRWALG